MPEQCLLAIEFVLSGGPVMFPLLLLSVCLWSLILYTLAQVAAFSPRKNDSAQQRLYKDRLHRQMEKLSSGNRRINRRLLDCTICELQQPLSSTINTIYMLAATAPLLGLLGTVTGMITTFEAVSQFGTGNARALASGISQAMVTTQTGLMVAVPGMVAGYILKGKVNKIKGRLETHGLKLLKNYTGNGSV